MLGLDTICIIHLKFSMKYESSAFNVTEACKLKWTEIYIPTDSRRNLISPIGHPAIVGRSDQYIALSFCSHSWTVIVCSSDLALYTMKKAYIFADTNIVAFFLLIEYFPLGWLDKESFVALT